MPSNMEVRWAVEFAVESAIQACDVGQRLRSEEYDSALVTIADEVFDRLLEEMRPELDEADLAFIQRRVAEKVGACLDKPVTTRFERFERVVWRQGRTQCTTHAVHLGHTPCTTAHTVHLPSAHC